MIEKLKDALDTIAYEMYPEIVVIENKGLKSQTIKKAIEAATFYQKDIIAAMYPEIVVIENKGLKSQTIKKAIEAVTFYQKDIIAAWHDFFSKK